MKSSIKYFGLSLPILFAGTLIFTKTTAQSSCLHNNFGTIEVPPVVELNGYGKNVDTIEFWKAPNINNSLMFVSSKDTSVVEVWKYPFGSNDEQAPIGHSTLEPDNAEVNGLQVDPETDLLYVSVGSPNSHVVVFSIPDLTYITHFNSNGNSYHVEPNLTLLNLPNGDKHLYVSADNIVYIHDISDLASQDFGNLLGSFGTTHNLETMNADDHYQNLIIPDEKTMEGVYAYHPDGADYPSTGQNNFGASTIQGDGEGILLYNCSTGSTDQGIGFIVVSDQLTPSTEFEFYDRETWEYYGNMKVTGVSNTDGISSFPYSTQAYPMGVFAAINNDNTTVIVSWETIFDEIAAQGGLPVELTSFYSTLKNGATTTLHWETATEVNNYGFEVERKSSLYHSIGGKIEEWERIGFVEGNGNSNAPIVYSFIDEDLNGSGVYHYRLKQIDNDGSYDYSHEISVSVYIPTIFMLYQNYPNPFNPTTNISFSLPKDSRVRITVYNLLGQQIIEIVNDEFKSGRHSISFDANGFPSGVYTYRMEAIDFVSTRKMLLIR
jgi:hypothetical protein